MVAKRNRRAGSLSLKVDNALDVADRILSGKKITESEIGQLTWLENFLGLSKPLTSYSARTRRRYASGARQGKRAEQIRREEHDKRKARVAAEWGGITPSQLTIINRLRKQIQAYGMDVDPFFDDNVIQSILETYGYEYLITVWENQLESTRAYVEENSVQPGRDRWHARGELESRFRHAQDVSYESTTDPYYYYHGKKS